RGDRGGGALRGRPAAVPPRGPERSCPVPGEGEEEQQMSSAPVDVAALAGWLRSWVGAEGQIRGFHNHSVWGTNPATFIDFTSGHQAFAAPALAGLATALARRPDARGAELWRAMMLFQARTT